MMKSKPPKVFRFYCTTFVTLVIHYSLAQRLHYSFFIKTPRVEWIMNDEWWKMNNTNKTPHSYERGVLFGRGRWIRTTAWGSQSPLPYRLAIPLYSFVTITDVLPIIIHDKGAIVKFNYPSLPKNPSKSSQNPSAEAFLPQTLIDIGVIRCYNVTCIRICIQEGRTAYGKSDFRQNVPNWDGRTDREILQNRK